MRAHKTYKGIRTCNSNESVLDFEVHHVYNILFVLHYRSLVSFWSFVFNLPSYWLNIGILMCYICMLFTEFWETPTVMTTGQQDVVSSSVPTSVSWSGSTRRTIYVSSPCSLVVTSRKSGNVSSRCVHIVPLVHCNQRHHYEMLQ